MKPKPSPLLAILKVIAITVVVIVALVAAGLLVLIKTSGLSFGQVHDLVTHYQYLNQNHKRAQTCQVTVQQQQAQIQALSQQVQDPAVQRDPAALQLNQQQLQQAQAGIAKVRAECEPVLVTYQKELVFYVTLGQEVSQKDTWLGKLLRQAGIGKVDAASLAAFKLDDVAAPAAQP